MIFKVLIVLATTVGTSLAVFSQSPVTVSKGSEVGPIRASAAFSVVLLRKTEIEADLVSFADDYTEENPRVVDARTELASINKEIDRMFTMPPSETGRLTESTGKLILRKAEIETEMNRILRTYKPDHPQAKRLAKKVDIYQKALKQIFG